MSWLHSDRGWLLGDLKASPFANPAQISRPGPESRGRNEILGCIRLWHDCPPCKQGGMLSWIRSWILKIKSQESISARPGILMPHFSPVWSQPFPLPYFYSWHLDKYSSYVPDLWNHILQARAAFLMSPFLSFWDNFTYIFSRFILGIFISKH